MYYQQGDCLLKTIDKLPPELIKQDHLVLAEGEATGHRHIIGDRKSAVLYLVGAVMYLRVLRETELKHEEHKTLVLPAGYYLVDRVREYDHLREEARQVRD